MTQPTRWTVAILAYALVGAATLALGVLAEFALRVVYPEHVPATPDHAFLAPDPVLGYALAPDVDATFRRSEENGGAIIRWRSNAAGYRGGELSEDPRLRVVVYGDSNVQAVFSNLEDTLPAQLATRLSTGLGFPVEVVNGGTLGHGPDHYLLRFVEEFPRLKPDVVVFNIFADNDFGDPIRHRLLDLRNGELHRRPDPFVYPRLSVTERVQRFASSLLLVEAASRVLDKVSPSSHRAPDEDEAGAVSAGGSSYVERLQQLVATEQQQYESRAPAYTRIDHYDIDVATDSGSASARARLDLLAGILREARRRAEEFGVIFVVLIEPSRVDLVDDVPLSFRQLERFPGYRPANLTDSVATLCVREGIEAVNLFPVFSQRGAKDLYFRGDDNHWNDRGQSVAAETLAIRLLPLVAARASGAAPARPAAATSPPASALRPPAHLPRE